MRSNFVSIPSDCPQRDERLGWTGDAQVVAPTACIMFDSDSFWQSWLRDLELDQDDSQGVSSVVPDAVLRGDLRFGRAGWGDAATMVPWAVYTSYGDPEVLRRQYRSMCRWVDLLARRRTSDGLIPASPQFGDWLDPDAPSDRPWEAKTDPQYLANAYFAHSARLLADAAGVLGRSVAASRYRALSSDASARTWRRWRAHAVGTQTGCAAALRLGIAPEQDRAEVGAALAHLVDEREGRVATGFLGTPMVLPALADTGHFEQAFRMLLSVDAPSWLYQVVRGATTVWERWDAVTPDGSIHPGTIGAIPGSGMPEEHHDVMLSFNHCAYGSVIDWVYRHVGGLAPDPTRPGYALVRFEPRPFTGCRWAGASVESRFGSVRIDWRIEDGRFIADVALPPRTEGVFQLPCTADSEASVDDVCVTPFSPLRMRAGNHRVTVSHPAVVAVPGREPAHAHLRERKSVPGTPDSAMTSADGHAAAARRSWDAGPFRVARCRTRSR